MSEDTKIPTSLSTMFGSEAEFEAKGKTYKVYPILSAHVEQFMKSALFIDNRQIYNLMDSKLQKVMNKWLGGEEITVKVLGKDVTARYFFDENNEPMSFEKTMADGWDVTDYERYLKKLCNLSD